MLKCAMLLVAALGTSVATYAAMIPAELSPPMTDNVTIIYKNQAWPVLEPLVIEYCGLEDCSDTRQNLVQ